MSDALVELVTALADDELVIGHRHSEWTGFAPFIEEDVAFSSIAQDELGHAAALYGLLGRLTGLDADAIALGRAPGDYRNAILCERPNRDWAYSLARHWVYDVADDVRLEALAASSNADLAALARKIRREERYHLAHADAWITRVAAGPVEGRTRLVEAVGDVLRDAPGLFEPIEREEEAVAQGLVAAGGSAQQARFGERLAHVLDRLGLPTSIHAHVDRTAEFVASSSGDLIAPRRPQPEVEAAPDGLGGRRGRHTDDFGALWDDLTHTYRHDPAARW